MKRPRPTSVAMATIMFSVATLAAVRVALNFSAWVWVDLIVIAVGIAAGFDYLLRSRDPNE